MKTFNIKKWIIPVLISLIVISTLFFLGTSYFNDDLSEKIIVLDDGWVISLNDEVTSYTSISSADIGVVNDSDVITLSTTLTNLTNTTDCLSFRTILAKVKVYVSGSLVYTYGYDYDEENLMLPKHYNYIPLTKSYEGKEIVIEIEATEDSAFNGISKISMGNLSEIKKNLLQTKKIPIFLGFFLCVFGFTLFILSGYVLINENKDFTIIFDAIISLCLGIYILCYNDIFQLLFSADYISTVIEYFSLYILPAAFVGYMFIAKHTVGKKVTLSLFTIDILFFFTTLILHSLKILHVNSFVTWAHILLLIESPIVIGFLIYSIFKLNRQSSYANGIASLKVLFSGLVALLTFALMDLINFNISKYSIINGDSNTNINFVIIGAVFFVTSLLVNYFYYSIDYLNSEKVKTSLETLAYNDYLTNVANRTKCEKTLAELNKADSDYTIISIDVDKLKETNDSLGHTAGDKLLSDFSQETISVFSNAKLIGRMGGDEFIIILNNDDFSGAKKQIEILEDNLKKKGIYISYGLATSKEALRNSSQVYMIADKKMYAMKLLHHRKYSDQRQAINKQQEGGFYND